MFENYDFIEEVNEEGYEAFILYTSDEKKKIMFTLVDNKLHQTSVVERAEGEYEDENQNIYKFSSFFDITEKEAKYSGVVFNWDFEDGTLAFSCLVDGEIKVKDLESLRSFVTAESYYYLNHILCAYSLAERAIKVYSLRGVHKFNLDLYNQFRAKKIYKLNDRLKAKYALLGDGELLLSDKGELISLKAGRNKVLRIPNTCKIIKKGSIFENGAKILKIGAGVEKCEQGIFYKEDNEEEKIDFEFDGTSAEIVSRIFLDYYFGSSNGYWNIQRVAIEVKNGLSEVLTGVILAAADERFRIGDLHVLRMEAFLKYFLSGSRFNICKNITKEDVIQVLDDIAEYIKKNIDKSLEFSIENIVNYMGFSRVVFGFKASMRGLLTKEENKFYDKAFGAIYKFATDEAEAKLKEFIESA